MASFTIKGPDGATQVARLFRRLTSIGSSTDNDIVIADAKLPETALAVLYDGQHFRLGGESSYKVNGQPSQGRNLDDGDTIVVGDSELIFAAGNIAADAPLPVDSGPDVSTVEVHGMPLRELAAFRRLSAFSERLLRSYQIDEVLENLIDECIEVARADKGFLILLDSGIPRIKTARNVRRESIADADQRVSDSIVNKVVALKEPVIIADALAHPDFSASASVVSLNLLSVMCVPLMYKGDIFGLIYLGNDRLVSRFDRKSLETLTVFAAQASLLLQNAMLVNDLRFENVSLKSQLQEQTYGDIIGACPGMRQTYRQVDRIAPTDITVLITGETGTGKELIAKEIHRHSLRAKGPFISLNCAAIPENLLESDLFGHVKGSFTGAIASKPGRFQSAIGGTLFLDEVGELPLNLQVKLLRALQEKVVTRVGDTRAEPVDIRIVTATNRDLETAVREGKFREDLYFRINVVTLKLPSLRERGGDVDVLARFFLNKYASEFKSKARGFTPRAVAAMRAHDWPGNVRELENRIKRAAVMADRALLTAEDLELTSSRLAPVVPLAQAKEEFQKQYINDVLERNHGNRTQTAKDLGVDPRTVFRHLERTEVDSQNHPMTSVSDPSDPRGD